MGTASATRSSPSPMPLRMPTIFFVLLSTTMPPLAPPRHPTFLVTESQQTLAGLADELAVPVNQAALRVPVERVGVDVCFGAVLQIIGVETNAVEVLEGMPHLVDGKIVSRSIL